MAALLFKKFTWKEDVSGQSQLKSSVQRATKQKLIEMYPGIEPVIEEILPKKQNWNLVKSKDGVKFLTIGQDVLFFNHFDGPWIPTLRLLHKYPDMMTKIQVDKGAIKFLLSGANIMCPGLTSKGAKLPEENIPEQTFVAVMAEGKEHAIAIGLMTMSSDDIKKINKGPGVDNIHYLGDDLWLLQKIPQ